MSSRRIKQMASLMREELARLMLHEVSDPRLQDLVVTDVEMTADLKRAYVYFTRGALGTSASDKEVMEGLKKAMPFLRRKLGSELKLRSVPELQFEADTHSKDLTRILGLLESVTEPEFSPAKAAQKSTLNELSGASGESNENEEEPSE